MTKLIFHIRIGDLIKGPQKELEIRDQPLQHEIPRLLKAIGDALSEVRPKARRKQYVITKKVQTNELTRIKSRSME